MPGVGFGLRTNALRALREIGLYDQCLSIGFASPTLTYYDRHGDHVVELPFGRQIDGMPNNVLLPRLGFLEIATARALELGCTLRMSTTIAHLEQDADGSVRDVQRRNVGTVRRGDRIRRHQVPDTTGAVRAEVRPGSQRRRGVAGRTARSGRPDSPRSSARDSAGKVAFAPLAGGMMYMLVTHFESGRPRYDPAQFAQIMYERARAIMGDSDFMSDSIEQVLEPPTTSRTPFWTP